MAQEYGRFWVGLESDPVTIIQRGAPLPPTYGISTTRRPILPTVPLYIPDIERPVKHVFFFLILLNTPCALWTLYNSQLFTETKLKVNNVFRRPHVQIQYTRDAAPQRAALVSPMVAWAHSHVEPLHRPSSVARSTSLKSNLATVNNLTLFFLLYTISLFKQFQ